MFDNGCDNLTKEMIDSKIIDTYVDYFNEINKDSVVALPYYWLKREIHYGKYVATPEYNKYIDEYKKGNNVSIIVGSYEDGNFILKLKDLFVLEDLLRKQQGG